MSVNTGTRYVHAVNLKHRVENEAFIYYYCTEDFNVGRKEGQS